MRYGRMIMDDGLVTVTPDCVLLFYNYFYVILHYHRVLGGRAVTTQSV